MLKVIGANGPINVFIIIQSFYFYFNELAYFYILKAHISHSCCRGHVTYFRKENIIIICFYVDWIRFHFVQRQAYIIFVYILFQFVQPTVQSVPIIQHQQPTSNALTKHNKHGCRRRQIHPTAPAFTITNKCGRQWSQIYTTASAFSKHC